MGLCKRGVMLRGSPRLCGSRAGGCVGCVGPLLPGRPNVISPHWMPSLWPSRLPETKAARSAPPSRNAEALKSRRRRGKPRREEKEKRSRQGGGFWGELTRAAGLFLGRGEGGGSSLRPPRPLQPLQQPDHSQPILLSVIWG